MTGEMCIDPYVIILGGGIGSRMAPLSTDEKPKQFHALISNQKTLMQETFTRVSPLARRDRLYVATAVQYVDLVKEQLPDLVDGNIIVEPSTRDTMPAIAHAAQIIYNRDPDATIMIIPSDHAVKNTFDFVRTMQVASAVVNQYPEMIGLLGIQSTGPSTSLGYVRRGDEIQGYSQVVFKVDSFKEKPDIKLAEKYHDDPDFFWNGGYFIFNAGTLLELTQEHVPHVAEVVHQVANIDDPEEQRRKFNVLNKASIDTAILEKLSQEQCFVVPADLGWSDVGTWNALYEHLHKDDEDNVCRGNVTNVSSKDNIIFSKEKKVVTFGVENLVIVETDDTIAIVHRECSDNIKEINDLFEEKE